MKRNKFNNLPLLKYFSKNIFPDIKQKWEGNITTVRKSTGHTANPPAAQTIVVPVPPAVPQVLQVHLAAVIHLAPVALLVHPVALAHLALAALVHSASAVLASIVNPLAARVIVLPAVAPLPPLAVSVAPNLLLAPLLALAMLNARNPSARLVALLSVPAVHLAAVILAPLALDALLVHPVPVALVNYYICHNKYNFI